MASLIAGQMECRRLYGMSMSMIDTAGQQRTGSTFESLIRNCWWNFDCRYARSRVFHSKSYDFYAVVIRQIAAEYIRCAKKKKKMSDVGGRSENIDNTNRRATVRDHSTIFCTTNIGICSVMGPIFVQ